VKPAVCKAVFGALFILIRTYSLKASSGSDKGGPKEY